MRPKKIVYVPGLISLLGLPLILLFFGPEAYKHKTSLRLFVPKDEMTPDSTKFTKGGVYSHLKNKKIVQINLWDNYRDYYERWDFSMSKMIFIEREIQRLQFTNDTTTVLKIELASPNTYADFIEIMNLTIVYHIRRWAFLDNSFYLLPNQPPTNPDLYAFENIYPMPVTVDYEGPTRWERFKWWLDYQMLILPILIKYNYILIIGFVLLILIPWILAVRSMRKKQRLA